METTIPEGATHIWEPKDGFYHPWVTRLNFYKKDPQNNWLVYSEVTGWRVTANDQTWFDTETKEGFFHAL